MWIGHVAEPSWSIVIFHIFPCSYLPSFTYTIMSFQFISAVFECSFISCWTASVPCCCLEWEPCFCFVLSSSHGFTIYPFLALAVLLLDAPMRLFKPRKWQKTPGFPAQSSFAVHTQCLVPLNRHLWGRRLPEESGRPYLAGHCVCHLTWLQLKSTWSVWCVSCVTASKQGAEVGTKRDCASLWQCIAQWWVGPLPETTPVSFSKQQQTHAITLYLYLRKGAGLFMSLHLRKELHMMLRRARMKHAGGTWEGAVLHVEGSPLSWEASLRAWRSPTQETFLRLAEFLLRVHVEFAVLAAQKVYFDLQMAAFYM